MLEESRMDKKTTNRSSQPQSRASAVDCKKGSESTHKPATRYNKKREGPSSSAPKNEPYRKNVSAQRGRGQIDRRPRPRGAAGFNMGGAESSGLAEEDPELGSVFVPGSKKQNLNHLLNFMYTPRGVQDWPGQNSGRGAVARRNVPQRVTHPHNHDLYLQACCQFVVKEDGEYKANLLDPDVPVKWEQIEEIVVRSTGKSECPICLGPPSAGRVGRCGHVYCWACALHYSASHERAPPPCPVCAAPFRVEGMRPARLLQWEPPQREVTMILVRRLRGSTAVEVAPPRGQLTDIAEAKILPLSEINNAPYAKLFTATKQQSRDILDRERKELQNQILTEIDTTEIVYIEQALEMLKKQEEEINALVNVPKVAEQENELPPIIYEKNSNGNKIDWFDEEAGAACMESIQEQMSSLSVNLDQTNLNPDAAEFTADVNDNEVVEFPLIDDSVEEQIVDSNYLTDIDKENQAKYFYFYQASDGQQVFLCSINVRVLNASWGVLAAAPARLCGRVLARATHSLVDQTRKHMPYAAHLPLHCPFDIVELDLQPPYVTPLALDTYANELSRLARLRARTERTERRRERTARLLAEPPPRPDFCSDLLFPPPPPPPSPPPPQHAQPEAEGLSFAKMARAGGTWRVRASPPAPAPALADEGAGGSAPRTLLLSDAIAAALQSPAAAAAAAAAPAPAPHGKKKRSKPKVLFATGMPRTG